MKTWMLKLKKFQGQCLSRGGDEEYELRVKKIKNGVDRLFKKDVIIHPNFYSIQKQKSYLTNCGML